MLRLQPDRSRSMYRALTCVGLVGLLWMVGLLAATERIIHRRIGLGMGWVFVVSLLLCYLGLLGTKMGTRQKLIWLIASPAILVLEMGLLGIIFTSVGGMEGIQ